MGGWSVLTIALIGTLVAAVLGSYYFGWYSWRRADQPFSNRYAWLMLANGSWALSVLLQMISPTDSIARLLVMPEVLSAVLSLVFWFLFVIEYTGDREWIPPVVERVAIAHAPIYVALYGFNPSNLVYRTAGVAEFVGLRLPYEEFGLLGLLHLVFIYSTLLLTFVLLGRFYVKTRNLYRKQTGVIFLSTFLVVLANISFFAGLSPHPRLDMTPLFYAIQAALVGVALYRYDFMEVAPMAASTLLEEMADPVFVVDMDGQIIDWNDAADEFIGDPDRPTLSSVAVDGLEATFTSTETADRPESSEVTTIRRTGAQLHSVTYDVRQTPITDRYDTVRGTVMVLRDVTDRRAREHALETQNERLEEFTGFVSHDLRNPLQILSGQLELARQTGDLSHLDDASEVVERMETMLDDMLQLAREGQTIDEKEPVDITDCVRAAWETVSTAEATLVLETDHSVAADPDRLQQVFENLFQNAIEHGGPDVTITVGEFEDGIYVADDGEGIPDEERDDIFELGETTAEDGSGFGLAIVERIVEAHGWTIRLRESIDGGARFELTALYPSSLGD